MRVRPLRLRGVTTSVPVDPWPCRLPLRALWDCPPLVQLHVRELQVFLAVAETGSISAAAQRLFLDASAVGKLLSRLERNLDARLAVRSTRRITLTEAGERAVPAARAVLGAIEALAEQTSGLGRHV